MKLLELVGLGGPSVGPIRRRGKLRSMLSMNRILKAFSYESAEPGGVNEYHWSAAGSISARQANSPDVRETLRNRSRYETANNCVARGMVDTFAGDLIGDGPRLQIKAGESNGISRSDAQELERIWCDWTDAVDLWGKINLMVTCEITDGEIFATMVSNELVVHPVKLDLTLIEAERIANPYAVDLDILEVDGIKFDVKGNPVKYRVLKHHPDDRSLVQLNDEQDHDWLDAEDVIHHFTPTRAGQVRGVPRLTPALALFAQARRFTGATLTAAENAANNATSIETQNPPDPDDDSYEAPMPLDEVPMTPGIATVLPDGYTLKQVKPEHPTTTFGEFRRQIYNEIGRPLAMPVNIVLADSSDHNYASGKLDDQGYVRKLSVDRRALRVRVLDRIFRAWLNEAQLVEGLIPEAFRRREPQLRFAWMWPARVHADPAKEGAGLKARMEAGVSNEIIECANLGQDWQDVLDGQREVQEYRDQIGLKPVAPDPASKPADNPPAGREGDDEDQ